jgi:hypothetical protein
MRDVDDLLRIPGGIPLESATLTLNKVERNFALVVKKVDVLRKEIRQ